jgi:hypothetical protein
MDCVERIGTHECFITAIPLNSIDERNEIFPYAIAN